MAARILHNLLHGFGHSNLKLVKDFYSSGKSNGTDLHIEIYSSEGIEGGCMKDETMAIARVLPQLLGTQFNQLCQCSDANAQTAEAGLLFNLEFNLLMRFKYLS